VQRAMRASGDEFERRYRSAFAQLPAQLQVSQATLRARFSDVLDELFRDGVNWGRVVAFFAFGGALCAECVDKELPGLVSSVATWMTSYLEDRLLWWIDDNGGWKALIYVAPTHLYFFSFVWSSLCLKNVKLHGYCNSLMNLLPAA
uniref:BCL2 like 2 n=1 Tax=Petromyzon marinus TaxID=7757 RepID=S4RB20_PETMA